MESMVTIDVNAVVHEMMSIDTGSLILYRLFTASDAVAVIKRRMNDILEDSPEMTDVVLALAVYPALVWNLKGKEIRSVMERISTENTEVQALKATQKLLVKASGVEPSLFLERRQAYFDACEAFIKILDKKIEKVREFPEGGEALYTVLQATIGKEAARPMTRFYVNKNLRKAIEVLYNLCGTELTPYLNVILNGQVVDDEELKAVYHNIALLLKEYNKILWYAEASDDKAMQLLSCKSAEDMYDLTESDGKYRDAYLIAEYVKLIAGAVELVKEFPVYGEEYYEILSGILDSKPQKIKDEALARKAGMSTFTYSVKKRRALAVLGCALWGCDSDTYIRLLASEA